ncbi:zinc finger protein 384-like isoform X2 [Heterodontus francisci]|uniref:zinc finger protein 384-like isoform X2 n=1 Tax=Heterodontus francisci TaxID=7792 RepID=UPI00355B38D8
MEESHYNNNYFWTPISTMAGQFENVMFINKIKEQLMSEKACSQSQSPPQPSQQQSEVQPYPPVLISCPGQTPSADIKQEGQAQPVVTENVTVLPLPSTALMTGLVIASPSASLAASSGGLVHTPTFSLASAPAMIVSGLAAPLPPGLEKKAPDAAPAPQDEGHPKTPGARKRKGRLGSEPTLAELADPYAVPNDDDGTKDGKSYRLGEPGRVHVERRTEGGCRICPLSFGSKSEMQLHAKSHTESKPHHCPHCSKTFANTSYLAQHIRIHSGAKPYNCSYCQKNFRQLSHLQQHTRIHTGDRPYKCAQPGCDKSFTQLSNLQSHRRQHNKDKPYKCPHCHRAYTDSPSLQVHLATHTVKHMKAYACNSCRKSYTSETYLMKHMRKHKAPETGPDPYGAAPPPPQGTPSDPAQCSFDLLPFKANPHKDPCLTVSASALQVDQMGGS